MRRRAHAFPEALCNGNTTPSSLSPRVILCRSLPLQLDLVQLLVAQGVNAGHVRPRSPPSRPSGAPRLRAAVTCLGRCVTVGGGRVRAGDSLPSFCLLTLAYLSDGTCKEMGGYLCTVGTMSPPLCQRRRSRCRRRHTTFLPVDHVFMPHVSI